MTPSSKIKKFQKAGRGQSWCHIGVGSSQPTQITKLPFLSQNLTPAPNASSPTTPAHPFVALPQNLSAHQHHHHSPPQPDHTLQCFVCMGVKYIEHSRYFLLPLAGQLLKVFVRHHWFTGSFFNVPTGVARNRAAFMGILLQQFNPL